LRLSAILVTVKFPTFLLVVNPAGKTILVGFLGLLNAGWYVIPKGQLYSALSGQSGSVMTIGNVFGLIGGLIPLFIGLVVDIFGLQHAMWMILAGPLVLVFWIPRHHSLL
jgi:FSR family fosmidomycin resistance protein-like MFS transporter